MADSSELRFILAKRIYRALNELQRRNRFISVSAGKIDLSRVETFLLIELQADEKRGIAELAELLRLDRSTVSRALSSLLKAGLLRAERGSEPKDSPRRKIFRITPAGIQAIRAIDAHADKIVKVLAAAAGPGVLPQVVTLFRELANRMSQPPGKRRPQESEYRVEQRRVTRAFRLLSEQAFDSGLTHLSFHILLLLRNSGQMTAAQAASILNAQAAAMSLAVRQLEKKTLIERHTSTVDRRSMFLSLEPLGERLLEKTEERTARLLAGSLRNFPGTRLAALVEAFERFVGGRDAENARLSRQDLSVQNLATEKQRRAARTFAIRELVRLGRESECPEVLFSGAAKCFGLFKDRLLIGVEQWTADGEGRHRIELAVCAASAGKDEQQIFRKAVLGRLSV